LDEISKSIKRQRKLSRLPNIFKNITNKGVANFTTKQLNKYEEAVLSLGFKFILKPNHTNDSDIYKSLDNFVRDTRLSYQFQDIESMKEHNVNHNLNEDFNICDVVKNQLHVKNSNFQPKLASYAVEHYLECVQKRFAERIQCCPVLTNKIPT
jgi:hypothetical protein